MAHGDGHIVNTASLAGLTTGTVVPASYHTAKHGVVALSECLFGELAQRAPGVGVTVLCPGFVKTRINENDRNRPEDLAPSPFEPESPRSVEIATAMAEMTLTGLEPAQVADLVHDAVIVAPVLHPHRSGGDAVHPRPSRSDRGDDRPAPRRARLSRNHPNCLLQTARGVV